MNLACTPQPRLLTLVCVMTGRPRWEGSQMEGTAQWHTILIPALGSGTEADISLSSKPTWSVCVLGQPGIQ